MSVVLQMDETIVSIEASKRANKKYKATVRSKQTGKTRVIHFGHSSYPQFRDSTPLRKYSSKDHGDKKRRQAYFSRHSGTSSKHKAVQKERKSGKYSARLLSHMYLW